MGIPVGALPGTLETNIGEKSPLVFAGGREK
jgi:hypothetical protein